MNWISSANNVIGYRLQEFKLTVAAHYTRVPWPPRPEGLRCRLRLPIKTFTKRFLEVKFDPSHKSSVEVKDRENSSSALLLVFTGCGNGRACLSIFLIIALY